MTFSFTEEQGEQCRRGRKPNQTRSVLGLFQEASKYEAWLALALGVADRMPGALGARRRNSQHQIGSVDYLYVSHPGPCGKGKCRVFILDEVFVVRYSSLLCPLNGPGIHTVCSAGNNKLHVPNPLSQKTPDNGPKDTPRVLASHSVKVPSTDDCKLHISLSLLSSLSRSLWRDQVRSKREMWVVAYRNTLLGSSQNEQEALEWCIGANAGEVGAVIRLDPARGIDHVRELYEAMLARGGGYTAEEVPAVLPAIRRERRGN